MGSEIAEGRWVYCGRCLKPHVRGGCPTEPDCQVELSPLVRCELDAVVQCRDAGWMLYGWALNAEGVRSRKANIAAGEKSFGVPLGQATTQPTED